MFSEPTLPVRLSIPDWSEEDRPREKFALKGASSLSDAELIAILLRTGSSQGSALDLSKSILALCGNSLNRLSKLSLEQLVGHKGIGQAKAITLLAAFELGNRIRAEKVKKEMHIRGTQDVVDIMQDKIANLKHEEFWVLYLNQSLRMLKASQIGKGGLSSTLVDVRILLQEAILQNATSIILCHNHPSGSLQPSKADIQLTRQICEAAHILNIEVMDHIIIHQGRYFSFAENGKL